MQILAFGVINKPQEATEIIKQLGLGAAVIRFHLCVDLAFRSGEYGNEQAESNNFDQQVEYDDNHPGDGRVFALEGWPTSHPLVIQTEVVEEFLLDRVIFHGCNLSHFIGLHCKLHSVNNGHDNDQQ